MSHFVDEWEDTSAERRLWFSVIHRALLDAAAVTDLMTHERSRGGVVRAARRWLMSDRTDYCSFLWCCEYCGLEPKRVRRLLKDPQLIADSQFACRKRVKVLMNRADRERIGKNETTRALTLVASNQ